MRPIQDDYEYYHNRKSDYHECEEENVTNFKPSMTVTMAKTIERNWQNIFGKEVKITDCMTEYIKSVHYLFDAVVENDLCIYARPYCEAATEESKLLLDFVTKQEEVVGSFNISFTFLHEILSRRKNLATYFRFVIDGESNSAEITQYKVHEIITTIKQYFGFI